MGLPTYYNTGTVSVAAGATAVTGSGTGWGDDVLLKGDLLMDPAQPDIPPQRIASITDNTHLVLAFPWPGAAMVAAPYEIRFVGDIERSTAQTRRYLEMLGAVDNTGIGIDAFGEFVDRAAFDDMVTGFTFLSLDGAGGGDVAFVYIKNSSAHADWSDPIDIGGPQGEPGEPGLIGTWRGAWATATAYAVNDAVQQGGSSYIATTAHTSGVFATDLAAGKWQLMAQAGAPGTPGTPGTNGSNGGLYVLRAVATANVAIANGLENGDTVDGVLLATGNVVLLTGQTAQAENGPYTVVASGAASRTPGYTTYDAIAGQYFGVMEGTAKADTLWRATSNRGGTLGTTPIAISEFTSGGGGAYVLKAGDTMSGDLTISKASPLVHLFKPAAGTSAGLLAYTGANARWRLMLSNTEAESGSNAGSNFVLDAFTDAGGYLSSPLRITRDTGVVQLQNGRLNFPATQNPSSDPNTLDDYEEGTFTATIAFGGSSAGVTYTTQAGEYIKVGRLVQIQIQLALTNNGSGAGSAVVGGLPFVGTSTATNGVLMCGLWANLSGVVGSPVGIVSFGAATVSLAMSGAANSPNMTDTNITNTATMYLAGLYQAAA